MNSQIVYDKGIDQEDSSKGIKFDDRFTLSWPPDTTILTFLSRPSMERGTSRELVTKDGVTTEKITVGRVSASTREKASIYLSLAIDKISSNFKPPQTRPDTTCELSLVIGRTGAIRDIEVKHSTGLREWDQWAIDAVQQAKLPSLYDDAKLDFIPVSIIFSFD